MSIIDNFMSEVIDLNETEKEETILFLAKALLCDKDADFVRKTSQKVMLTVLPFLVDVATEHIRIKIEKEGGEKIEVGRFSKMSKDDKR